MSGTDVWRLLAVLLYPPRIPSRYLFFPFLIESLQFFGYIELSNAGMHFVGDVPTAHSGEKYMYAGRYSISSPEFLKMLKHYPFFRSPRKNNVCCEGDKQID